MPAEKGSAATIDEFIAAYPPEVQQILQNIRALIHQVAPEAQEAIKYGIPTFILHGNLVHFSAYQHHIGFYPAPSGIEAFKTDLAPYAGAKGSIRFPLSQPIPYDLIRKIVAFRVAENRAKAQSKKKGRTP